MSTESHLGSRSDPVFFTQNLIRCKSVTPVDDGVIGLASDFLKNLGFKTSIIESGPPDWCIKNLYATFGQGSPNLAVIGHLDVVPAGNLSEWSHDPFAADIENGILIGRGSVDMKSGFACAAAAAEAVANDDLKGTISFLVTGDEEVGTEHGMRSLLQWCCSKNIKFDACLVAEPTGFGHLGEAFCIGHRGSINIDLVAKGVQGHVACPEKANNPLTPLVSFLNFLKFKTWDTGEGSFPPTNLEITSIDVGNPVTNLIPSCAKAKFNIRYNRLHNIKSILKDLETAKARFFADPEDLSIKVTENFEPFVCENEGLISCMKSAIVDVLKTAPEISTGGGTTDGRFISEYCPVVEFGVPCDQMHKANESIAVSDIIKLTEVYKKFYKRFFAEFSC